MEGAGPATPAGGGPKGSAEAPGPAVEAQWESREGGVGVREGAPELTYKVLRPGATAGAFTSPAVEKPTEVPGKSTDEAKPDPPEEARRGGSPEGSGGGGRGEREIAGLDNEEGPEWEPGMEPEDSMSSSDFDDSSSELSEPFSLSSSDSSEEEEEEMGTRAEPATGSDPGGDIARSLVPDEKAAVVSGQLGAEDGSGDKADWGNFLAALHEGRLLEESDSDDDLDLDEFLDADIRLEDLVERDEERRAARPLTRAEGPVEDYDLDDYEAALEAAEWELTGNDRREYKDFLADFFAHAEADEDSGDEQDGDYVAKWGALQLPELLTPSKRRMPSPRRAAKRNVARPILGNINVAAKAKDLPLLKAGRKLQAVKPESSAINKAHTRAAASRTLQFPADHPAPVPPTNGAAPSTLPPPVLQAAEKSEPSWACDELAYLEEQSLSKAHLFNDTFRPKQVEELYWQMQALVQLLLQGCATQELGGEGPGSVLSKAKAKAKSSISKKEKAAAAKLAAAKAEEEQKRVLKFWEHLQDILGYTHWVSTRNAQLRFPGVPFEALGMGAMSERADPGDQEAPDPHGSEAWVPWRGRLIHFVQGITDNTLIRKLHHMVMTQQAVGTAMVGTPLDMEAMRFEEDFNPFLSQREMKRLMRNKMQLFTPAEDRLLAIGIRTLGNNYHLIRARLLPGKEPGQINTRRRNVLQRSSNMEIKSAMAELHRKLSPELLREIQAALDKYRDLPPSSRWEMVSLSPSPLLRGHPAAVLKQMWESMNGLPWKTKHNQEEKSAPAGPSSVRLRDRPQGSLEKLLEDDSESKEMMDPDWGLGVFNNSESLPGGPAVSPSRDTPFEQDEMEESGPESDGGQVTRKLSRPGGAGEGGSLSTGAETSAGRAASMEPTKRRGHQQVESHFSQDEPDLHGAGKAKEDARPFEVGAAEREELSDSEPDGREAEKEPPEFERELLSDSD